MGPCPDQAVIQNSVMEKSGAGAIRKDTPERPFPYLPQ